jgi:hypothetical protein
MRRLITIVCVLSLAGAGVAYACDQADSVKQVTATFSATTGNNVNTSTCTGSDGSYALTHGTWTGTATSTEPTLNGTATIDAKSLVNTTSGYGTVSGRLQISNSNGQTTANFNAVYANGQIAGLAVGRVSGAQTALVANLSSAWSATNGFTNGAIGGTSGGSAVELSSGGCRPNSSSKPETITVHGSVTAVSSTSISAAGVTCTVPSNLASSVSSIQVGTRVDMKCESSNGTDTLLDVNAAGNNGNNGQQGNGGHVNVGFHLHFGSRRSGGHHHR